VVSAHRRAGLRRNGRRQFRAVGKDLRAEPATTVPPGGPGAHVGDRPCVRGLGDDLEPPGRFDHDIYDFPDNLLLYRLLEPYAGRFVAGSAVALLSTFVSAPVLQLAYKDGFALMFIIKLIV